MKILDKIALNRLIAIITSFILSIVKLFAPNTKIDLDDSPKRKTLLDKLKELRKRKKDV